MLPYGFCTLAQLKSHLSIADTVDDALLQRIINMSAGAIENCAGRTLRRDHARTEVFTGGCRTIQTDVSPIAKIHSIRESPTRDFTTAGSYIELVEEIDYTVEGGGDGGRPGESGIIRRLNGYWMGGEQMPGCVQVVYTGGYKNDEEVALEDTTLTLPRASTEIDDLVVAKSSAADASDPSYTLSGETSTEPQFSFGANSWIHAILRFKTAGIILPTWQITSLALTYYAKKATAGTSAHDLLLLSSDPLYQSPAGAFAAVENGTVLYADRSTSATYSDFVFAPLTGAHYAAVQASLFQGHISFALVAKEPDVVLQFASYQYATAGNRPSLAVTHHRLFNDSYSVPDDLREANMIQAAHEYQTRRNPGMISQSSRGVSIASGASYLKTLAGLLPEVRMIAEGYARLV